MKSGYGKRKKPKLLLFGVGSITVVAVVVALLVGTHGKKKDEKKTQKEVSNVTQVFDEKKEEKEEQQKEEQQNEEGKKEEQKADDNRQEVIAKANLLSMQYDYKAAIRTIKEYNSNYQDDEELNTLVASYEEKKSQLDLYGAYDRVDEISHVFFHSLIADTSKAFDGDHMSNGYNYWMTTVDEFNKMMQQMYDDGYVLVSIHDVAREKKDKDGKKVMVPGKIMLPKDKKPFVLSQDDVNYYDYMQTDGFAKKIVIDEDGYPACEIEIDGEIKVARDYDVVPLLEKFIEEHPDFSYHGARGIIGVTGYEGVMGYRVNDTESETYEEDVKQAKAVAKRLKEIGWEFASHSYGHGHMGQKSASYVKEDSEHWAREDATIIGDTDIYLFPYGEDIQEGVGDYKGEKYETLHNLGFRYFCGVYAYPWIQVKDHYVRMTRRNLDGYTMHFYPERLKDLFDVKNTIDPKRPEFQ